MNLVPRNIAFKKPTRVRFGVLGSACSLSLLTYLDRICIMRAADNMQEDLGFSLNEMGLIFSAFTFGYMLFEVPGGWMGDVWGSRRVIARIVLCWSLFTALTGCVWAFTLDSGYRLPLGRWTVPLVFNSLLALLLIRFLFGVGEAGAYPNLTRVVSGWFPLQERGGAIGAIWFCARLGGAAGMVGVENLGEEDPEADQRADEAVAEGNRLGLQGVADVVLGQQFGEGQARSAGELCGAATDLADEGRGGSMSHGWPPCRWEGLSPPTIARQAISC